MQAVDSPAFNERDWVEDIMTDPQLPSRNCGNCGRDFRGHQSRHSCKQCCAPRTSRTAYDPYRR